MRHCKGKLPDRRPKTPAKQALSAVREYSWGVLTGKRRAIPPVQFDLPGPAKAGAVMGIKGMTLSRLRARERPVMGEMRLAGALDCPVRPQENFQKFGSCSRACRRVRGASLDAKTCAVNPSRADVLSMLEYAAPSSRHHLAAFPSQPLPLGSESGSSRPKVAAWHTRRFP